MLPHVNVGSAATFIFDTQLLIVDRFIGDMFFHPDDQGGITQKRALKSFQRVDDVVIPNRDQFRLVAKISLGVCPFGNVSVSTMISRRFWVLHLNCDSFLIRTGVRRIGNLTDMKVASYARIVLARSLQLITTILDPQRNRSACAFSLTNDASTHYGRSYLDNRIRVHVDGKLHNFHPVAIPMYEAYTGENMFHLIVRILDVVCPRWKMQLVGVGSDGASSMTGQFHGVVTRLADESANTKFYRVWCSLHQFDLLLKHAYTDLCENEVVDIMKKFIAHLRLQPRLINQMKATCPQLITRWLVMGHVCKWLLDKRIALFEHIHTATKPITSAPSNRWWIIIAGIKALTDLSNPVFVKLQAPNILVLAQAELLDALAVDVSTMLGISNWEGGYRPSAVLFNVRMLVSIIRVVQKFLQGLGMYIQHTLDELDEDMTGKVVFESIGKLGVGIVDGIINIQAERNSQNGADNDLPHVLSHELIKMSTGNFGKIIVDVHLRQLWHSWGEECIAGIENEHRELVLAYCNEPALKSAIDVYARVDIKSFEKAWEVVDGRLGIAAVFANTASVESDFSILGWERDEYRSSMTGLSLEGVLHCKQYDAIEKLAS